MKKLLLLLILTIGCTSPVEVGAGDCEICGVYELQGFEAYSTYSLVLQNDGMSIREIIFKVGEEWKQYRSYGSWDEDSVVRVSIDSTFTMKDSNIVSTDTTSEEIVLEFCDEGLFYLDYKGVVVFFKKRVRDAE